MLNRTSVEDVMEMFTSREEFYFALPTRPFELRYKHSITDQFSDSSNITGPVALLEQLKVEFNEVVVIQYFPDCSLLLSALPHTRDSFWSVTAPTTNLASLHAANSLMTNIWHHTRALWLPNVPKGNVFFTGHDELCYFVVNKPRVLQ